MNFNFKNKNLESFQKMRESIQNYWLMDKKMMIWKVIRSIVFTFQYWLL